MGEPAAKQGDKIVATDMHIVIVPPGGTALLPHKFDGPLNGGLSDNVKIMKKPAATVGSTADNTPPHMPTAPGTSFANPPSNQGKIQVGSATVKINDKPAARNGDAAVTCNEAGGPPVGKVVASGTVMIG